MVDREPPSPPPTLATLLGSSTAGVLARFPIHPIDTVKARLQAAPVAATPAARTFVHALAALWRAEGLAGLYRGLPVALLGSGPAAMLFFTSYELARSGLPALAPALAGAPAVTHFAAGLLAEACSCVLWVPIDVVKERMQVQGARAPAAGARAPVFYADTRDAMRQILRREGLGGLYRGYGATVASFGPFSALYFVFYEQLKAAAAAAGGSGGGGGAAPLPFGAQVATASAAGAAASLLTSPLDLVKLRLQVQRAAGDAAPQAAAPSPYRYTGLLHGLRSIVAHEGWRALFRGAGARVAFHAPSTAITMTLFERCKALYAGLLSEAAP